VYTFTLLDALGYLIPGVQSEDSWHRCNQDAPKNYTMEKNDSHITLSWDPVPTIAGEFDPHQTNENYSLGEYQIFLHPKFEAQTSYGASGVFQNVHLLPRTPFSPGGGGSPDGQDYGWPLNDLENGAYELIVGAWNGSDYANGGFGSDCMVFDSNEFYVIEVVDGELTFTKSTEYRGE
jgi:hypothetical protein